MTPGEELRLIEESINKINEIYFKVSKQWEEKHKNVIFNQATTQVKDIFSHQEKGLPILYSIVSYTNYLNTDVNLELLKLSQGTKISHTRVKQLNSILFKSITYETKKVSGIRGSIPIKKCFNDLFGMRIITENNFDFETIKNFICEKFPKLKCIKSDKLKYKATHIYFKLNNFHYQWELQIWYNGYAKSNNESHKKHKQKYTIWEKQFNLLRMKGVKQ